MILMLAGFTRTNHRQVEISGRAIGAEHVKINGAPADFDTESYVFSADYLLNEGFNTFVITAVDTMQNASTAVKVYNYDIRPPKLTFTHKLPELTNKSRIDIDLRTESGAVVSLNNVKLDNASGFIEYRYNLKPGLNILDFRAADELGNETEVRYGVEYDNIPPVYKIITPKQMGIYFSQRLTIVGHTDDAEHIFINGTELFIDKYGNFKLSRSFPYGLNYIKVRAVDKAGNSSEKSVSFLIKKAKAPAGKGFIYSGDTIYTKVPHYNLTGEVQSGYSMSVDSAAVHPDKAGRYKFPIKIKGEGEHKYRIKVYEDNK